MNKIEEGIAANDAAITDVENNYMPVSGGLFTGNMGIAGNLEILGNDTLTLSTDGSITFPSAGGKLNGISDLKGISSTTAVSQKCLNDNYVAKSDLPSNLLKYQVINSTSDIGTDANTAYLILE